MTSQNWLIILLILIAFNYIFSTLLEYLNDRNWKDEIPKSLKDFYQKDKYLKAKEYKKISVTRTLKKKIIEFQIYKKGLVGKEKGSFSLEGSWFRKEEWENQQGRNHRHLH